MEWSRATFPEAPRDEPELHTVRDAYLSRVEHGPLRTYGRPHRYLKGAVYDGDGQLVTASQKIALTGYPWVQADPARQVGPDRVKERLTGRWLYGGHWIQHFGHFMVETITTLWPEGEDVEGLVFHKYLPRPWSVEPWQHRTLELLGLGDLPVKVVGTGRALRVDELVVPSRAVVPNGWAHPQARRVWSSIADQFRAPDAPTRVYLSRSRFNAERRATGDRRQPRTTAQRDADLDRVFAGAGFEVVAPEILPLDDQLRVVANAEVLAGCSGSALHMSAFAPDGAKVLEVGDQRSPTSPVKMQVVVDAASGHDRAFVPADTPAEALAEELAALPRHP